MTNAELFADVEAQAADEEALCALGQLFPLAVSFEAHALSPC